MKSLEFLVRLRGLSEWSDFFWISAVYHVVASSLPNSSACSLVISIHHQSLHHSFTLPSGYRCFFFFFSFCYYHVPRIGSRVSLLFPSSAASQDSLKIPRCTLGWLMTKRRVFNKNRVLHSGQILLTNTCGEYENVYDGSEFIQDQSYVNLM